MGLVKGTCYDGFPAPYDPSDANDSWIFFGSDAAYSAMTPLWGVAFTSKAGSTCGPSSANGNCRNDLQTITSMGVELIRLYDWEPRNRHDGFLTTCFQRGLQVLAPVSNYFLGDGFKDRDKLIPALIRSFADVPTNPSNYHPAIAGIIFGNELKGYTLENMLEFTTDWAKIEAEQFPNFRPVKLGHPLDFAVTGGEKFPCFGYWKTLVPPLSVNPIIAKRLFLAPQTYNDRDYLFANAEGTGKGWMDHAWERWGVPILFTEIGKERIPDPEATYTFVKNQLLGVKAYAAKYPDRLLGGCHFQFLDKVWVPNTTEGSFGAFTHTHQKTCRVMYNAQDFTHWDTKETKYDYLDVEILQRTRTYDAVVEVYKS